ncbi:hypothetical protein GCM10010503_48420 [Streptomyces lucensis JCM 4490]|uniref:Uncharacterized protein n=1 Tax=Streptomyces lucensis JCM 4490 TaxID=1306176 RepID=A0A918JAD0_9ACTN|nr:hypothetical protein GCM10010503_48420 [Streptomyces lucensis JCM 4490]
MINKTAVGSKPLVPSGALLHGMAVLAVRLEEMAVPTGLLLPAPTASLGECPNEVGHQATDDNSQQRR